MENIERLICLLRRVDAGESPERIREESHDFLSSLGPRDIAVAQQDILESGVRLEDIGQMCSSHIRLLDQPCDKLREDLPAGHVILRMLAGHDMIRCLLEDLLAINDKMNKLDYITVTAKEWEKLLHVFEHLSASERHLDIEEKIIFPAFEAFGMYALPRMLRAEHFELRYYTEQLREIVYHCCVSDFEQFKRRLDEVVHFIVPLKREHMHKEDNMLYPVALEVIEDDRVWKQLDSVCEQAGYCCF